MKLFLKLRIFCLGFGFFIGLSTLLPAQTPQSFSYQAVARDATGTMLVTQNVGFRFGIWRTDPVSGTMVYRETHNVTTDQFGIAHLNVGSGTVVSGNFSTIDWSNGPYFIKVAMDASGGTTYLDMGSSQLLSVPYALHSGTSDLSNTGVTAGSYGNGSNVGTFTVDEKGLLTAAGNTAIGIDASQVTGGTFLDARIPNLDASKITAGVLSVPRGGTGIGSYTTGNYLRASGATVLEQRTPAEVLADIGAGNVSGTGLNNQVTFWTGANSVSGSNDFTWNGYQLNITPSAQTSNTLIRGGNTTMTGNDNTVLGSGAFTANTSGSNNVAFGSQALQNNTTGNSNNALGYQALLENTSGYNNIALGYIVLQKNTIGYNNISIGWNSLSNNTSGNNNLAYGIMALNKNLTGSGNIGFGSNAFQDIASGNNNIALGLEAGRYYGTGFDALTQTNNSIFIGYRARSGGNSNTNQIVIGYDIPGLGTNTTRIGNSSTTHTHLDGSVSIGSTLSPGSRLVIRGSGTTSATSSLHVVNAINSSILFVRDDGNVGIGATDPAQRLDVNGQVRVRTIPNATGNYLTVSAGGVIQQRSAAEVLGDIGGGTGSGTVTSVGLSMPTQFTVTNSPVTTTGTLTAAWNSQSANQVFAGPASGTAVPTFRALVADDIPNLDAAKITTGVFSEARIPNLDASKITAGTFSADRIPTLDISTKTSGTLPLNRGGTGATTAAAARTNLGATTLGSNLFTLTNPSAITFLRVNADNSVSTLNASDFRTAIGVSASSLSGSGTTNYVTKWTGASEVGNSQIFDNGTNVGIGTSSPGAKLDISYAVDPPDQPVSALRILNTNGPGNNTTQMGFVMNRTTGGATEVAQIRSRITNFSDASYAGELWFLTSNTGSLPAERMRITAEGNIQIGTGTWSITNADKARMIVRHFNNSSTINTSNYPLRLENLSTVTNNQVTGIEFWNGTNKNVATARIISQRQVDWSGGEKLLFQTQESVPSGINTTQPTTKMVIENNGNVGIGTDTPKAKLHINGPMSRNAPNIVSTQTYTVTADDNWIILTYGSGNITITLPSASDWTGRELMFLSRVARYINSASSNVVGITGSTGTQILPNTQGANCTLVSDGANWVVVKYYQ